MAAALFVTWNGTLGRVETVDGVAVPSNSRVASLIENVFDGERVLTPADGDALVLALPFIYAGSYMRAVLDDGRDMKLWREELHPRDRLGQFRRLLGGRPIDRITGPVGPATTEQAAASRRAVKWSEEALEALKKDGGFTRSIYPGSAPPRRYISAVGGQEKKVKATEIKATDIFRYVAERNDRITTSLYVGAWNNEDDGYVYLDLSTSFDSRDEAVRFGRAANQIAIWDSEKMEEIRLDDEKAAASDEARVRGMRAMYGNLLPPPDEELDFSVDPDEIEDESVR